MGQKSKHNGQQNKQDRTVLPFSSAELAGISREIADAWRGGWDQFTSNLVLMPVDPSFAHVYWSIAPTELLTAGVDPATHVGHYCLRVIPLADNGNAFPERAFDYTVQGLRNDRSLWMPPGVRHFYAELGLQTEGGEFESFLQSNPVDLPPHPVAAFAALPPVGTPQLGMRPEPTLADIAQDSSLGLVEADWRAGVNGVEVDAFGFKERGVRYDELLIDRLIQEKLSRTMPGMRFAGLLERELFIAENDLNNNLSGLGLDGSSELCDSLSTQ